MNRLIATFAAMAFAIVLSGCQDALDSVGDKVNHPLPTKIVQKMKAADMGTRSPIMMRIFKEEDTLEIWKQKGNGRFDKIADYEICKWSGKLGPKKKEGDRQAPEGFYTIRPHQMNPNSSYYLSFNLGYPNRFDQSHGRTGSNLMVHGACSSAGCYSMSDENVLEIYAFAREAFKGGQREFQVQAFPFRMTAENMARHRNDESFEFWKMLKVGYDHFEITKRPPEVNVCERKYVFNQQTEGNRGFSATSACPPMSTPPALVQAYASYDAKYQQDFNSAVQRLAAEAEAREKAQQRAEELEIARAEAEKRRQERAEAANAVAGQALSAISGLIPQAIKPNAAQVALDTQTEGDAATPAEPVAANASAADVPVPAGDPREPAPRPVSNNTGGNGGKPFWKIW